MLLTDQSELVHRLTSPRHKVPKVYRATLDADLPAGLAEIFAAGTLVLTGEKEACAPAALHVLGPREAELTLTEGKYHQVRRMFASQGCEVPHAAPRTLRPPRFSAAWRPDNGGNCRWTSLTGPNANRVCLAKKAKGPKQSVVSSASFARSLLYP
ncbi:MAG: pseudouridine synthase [Lacunisphaera sp.]